MMFFYDVFMFIIEIVKGGRRMYNFCIVDDRIEDARITYNELKKQCDNYNLEYHCDIFNSPDDYNFNIHYDAVLLDIDMPKENGIELAKKINFYDRTRIIFVSSFEQYIHTSMDAHPFHFICKNNLEFECRRVFRQLIQELEKENDYIDTFINDLPIKTRLINVYYFDIDDHFCMAHLKNEGKIIQVRKNIISLKRELQLKKFAQINRSTIINMIYIKDIKKDIIILDNDVQLNITKRYKAEFIELYNKYLLGEI